MHEPHVTINGLAELDPQPVTQPLTNLPPTPTIPGAGATRIILQFVAGTAGKKKVAIAPGAIVIGPDEDETCGEQPLSAAKAETTSVNPVVFLTVNLSVCAYPIEKQKINANSKKLFFIIINI